MEHFTSKKLSGESEIPAVIREINRASQLAVVATCGGGGVPGARRARSGREAALNLIEDENFLGTRFRFTFNNI